MNEDRIKALALRLRGKTLAFCLPGRHYSGRFLLKFVELVGFCSNTLGLNLVFSQNYLPVVSDCRMRVAGADNFGGRLQQPFGGRPYDFMLWVDSDIAFEVEHLVNLLELDEDICAGWYIQPGGISVVVEHADLAHFVEQRRFHYCSPEEVTAHREPFPVHHVGFGWMLIRQGVFEKIPMPWFETPAQWVQHGGREFILPCSEDAAFCMKARAAGFRVMVDPRTRVGHEKEVII